MLYIFMGQSCTGKSTVANQMKGLKGVQVFAGKDYLRMAKNEEEAWRIFHKMLSDAASRQNPTEGTIVYLVSESVQLDRILDLQGARRVKFTASLDTIKSRFAQRMHGRLPVPVEKMLAHQFEEWEPVHGDFHVDTTVETDPKEILDLLGYL